MIGAMISGDAADRHRFAAEFVRSCGARIVLYITPQNMIEAARRTGIPAKFVAFEDLTKTEPWLEANALLGPHTAVVMENVTRYPKITSDKVLHLQRLCMQAPHRCIVDIVPFTLGIEYLYTPYSYLDRSILGFAHWYAFREGYMEQATDGTIVSSHDHLTLARKIAGVTRFGRGTVLPVRQAVTVTSTAAEREKYAALRAQQFETEKSPVKIITRLADFTHAFASRRAAVLDLVQSLGGRRVLVLANLATYAGKYQRAFEKAGLAHAAADSFRMAAARQDLGAFDALVYAEHPITTSYFALDVEAQCRRGAAVHAVVSDIKVCQYLYTRYRAEIDAIADFTNRLKEVTGSHG